MAVLDDGAPTTASVAAGMLAPWSEAEDDDQPMLAPMLRAAGLWPRFAEQLEEAGGRSAGYDATGSLVVAARPEHVGAVRRVRVALERAGRSEPWRAGSRLRDAEPGLAAGVAGGLELHDEAQADPRLVLRALRAAAERAGAVRLAARVTRVRREAGVVEGVDTDDGRTVACSRVVLAAGARSASLDARVPLRPVKGQILVLGPRGGERPLSRIVRTPDVYLVPRPDGRVIVGATVEEAADTVVTAEAVHRLLDEAIHTVPDLAELAYLEHGAGLRPVTPDGLPALGALDDDEGTIWATGGSRHGILLLPVVAEALDAALAGAAPSDDLLRFVPARLVRPLRGAAACA